jgi:hypothetical protein
MKRAEVQSKRKYLRRYGCLAHFRPHAMQKDHEPEVGTALLPRRKKGIHLGFSSRDSAWLIGVYQNAALHVCETRSVTFVEDILVKNVQELESPDPPIFEQLLKTATAVTGKSAAAGSDSPSDAGASDAQYQLQELKEAEWESSEESDGGSVSGQKQPDPAAPFAVDLNGHGESDNEDSGTAGAEKIPSKAKILFSNGNKRVPNPGTIGSKTGKSQKPKWDFETAKGQDVQRSCPKRSKARE